jgi:hypothetical protein
MFDIFYLFRAQPCATFNDAGRMGWCRPEVKSGCIGRTYGNAEGNHQQQGRPSLGYNRFQSLPANGGLVEASRSGMHPHSHCYTRCFAVAWGAVY